MLVDGLPLEPVSPLHHLTPLLYAKQLQGSISTNYTGGDSNIFIIKGKGPSTELTYTLVKEIISNIPRIKRSYLNFPNESDLQKLKERITELSKSKGESSLESLKNTYHKLLNKFELEKIRGDKEFKIIEYPLKATHPIWPNKKLILVVAILCGLCFGLAFNWIVLLIKRND